MEFQYILNGMLIGLSVSIPLGPMGVLTIQRTMNKGVPSGVASGLGAAMADTLFAIVAGFGLTIVSNFLTEHQTPILIVGSLFLVYLGYKMLTSSQEIVFGAQKKKKHNLVADFLSILLLTLSNPITIIILGAFFASAGFLDEDTCKRLITVLIFGVFAGAMLWWAFVVGIVNYFKDKILTKKLELINKITGIVVLVLGFAIAISVLFVK